MASRFRGDVSLILTLAAIFGPIIGIGYAVVYGLRWLGWIQF